MTPEMPDWNSLSPAPPSQGSAPDWNSLSETDEYHGSPGQQALTAVEGLASGATLGLSDLAETKLLGVDPKEIEARRAANPITNTLSQVGGGIGGALGLEEVLAPVKAATIGAKIAKQAMIGAGMGLTTSVSHDLAFGDPSLNASKMIENGALSAVLGGGLGAVAAGILPGASAGLKTLTSKIAPSAEVLKLNPAMLNPLDKLRVGLFYGLQQAEPKVQNAVVENIVNGMESLKEIPSGELLESAASPDSKSVVQKFNDSRNDFLKHFGNSEGAVDSEKVMNYVASPAGKTNAEQTTAFNHFFRNLKNLGAVSFENPEIADKLAQTQENLSNWMDLGLDAATSGPMQGSPGGYRTLYKDTPNATTISNFGNERISPFDTKIPSLDRINAKVQDFHEQVEKLLQEKEAQEGAKRAALKGAEGIENWAHPVQNINAVKEAVANAPKSIPGWVETLVEGAAAATGHPWAGGILPAYDAIRNYAGEGGLFRAGNALASPIKILNGISNHLDTVDQKISDKARLIFTGLSNEAAEGAR